MFKPIILSFFISFNASAGFIGNAGLRMQTHQPKKNSSIITNENNSIMQEPSHDTEKKDALEEAYRNRKKHFEKIRNKKKIALPKVKDKI